MRPSVSLCAALLCVLAASAPARAQHFGTGTQGWWGLDDGSCTTCHENHSGGARRNILRTDREAAGLYSLTTGGTADVDEVAQSCLRCHTTADRRARQPEFAAQSVGAGGRYLQLDLRDDHPLGRLDALQERATAIVPGNWGAQPGVSGRRLLSDFGGESGEISCTLCHDPHDRRGIRPEPDAEKSLCLGCHDPGLYVSTAHGSLVCSDCHQLHGGREGDLVAEAQTDRLCRSCHDAGRSSRERSLGVAPPLGHVEPPSEPCRTCHSAH